MNVEPTPTGDAGGNGAPDTSVLLQTLPASTRLVDISPGLALRSGLIPRQFVPSACVAAIFNHAPNWEQLAETTLGRLKSWHGVGPGRAAKVLAFSLSVSSQASTVDFIQPSSGSGPVAVKTVRPHSGLSNLDPMPASLWQDIKLISGWAVVNGVERGLLEALMIGDNSNAPANVKLARERLSTLDLLAHASNADLIIFDPILSAVELLSEFDDHDHLVLDRLLAEGIRPVATLEEIGQELNLSRERIRQIEAMLANQLALKLATEKYDAVKRHADALSVQLGSAFPVSDLPRAIAPEAKVVLVDELFAYLAGPFIQCDGWFVKRASGSSIEALLNTAFESSANGYAAPLDALYDALSAAGVHTNITARLLAACPRYHIIGNSVVRWVGIRDRVIGLLYAVGRPMSFDEIQMAVIDGQSSSSVRNFLANSPLVKRTKKNEWALASWEGSEYRNILEHMREELSEHNLAIVELASRLGDKFDISANSVIMYASMHPMFVHNDRIVRLRREDEPYVPTASLEMTADCYQINGCWSVAFNVDRDLMRGSGRVMPEAFAVHIGLQPGGEGSLQSADRSIAVAWKMNPYFGSLRWVVEREGLELGDRLFVIRSSSSELEFRFVKAVELAGSVDPTRQLQCNVGAVGSPKILERWLGDALGLGGASTPTLLQLRARLLAREESSLAGLLDGISR